jgi:hypothetical protein
VCVCVCVYRVCVCVCVCVACVCVCVPCGQTAKAVCGQVVVPLSRMQCIDWCRCTLIYRKNGLYLHTQSTGHTVEALCM